MELSSAPIDDVVRQLGHLALGTRLRRIGERLQADTQLIIDQHGVDIPVTWFPVLVTLDRLGAHSVGHLAQALGVTQPGVTRTVGKMVASGLVSSETDPADRRVRRIALTASGRELVERSKAELWPRIEAAVQDACSELSGSLLEQLADLEDALDRAPLITRGEHRASA